MVFGSFSMRTPNEVPNPDDYEVSIGISHSNFYANRQWERELGQRYIDDIVWLKYDKNHIYIKPEYFNKTSKNIEYIKLDVRYKTDFGVGYGATFRNDKVLQSIGYSVKRKTGKLQLEFTFDGYYGTKFDYEEKMKINYIITKHLRVYHLGEYNKLEQVTFYKSKIGLEYLF